MVEIQDQKNKRKTGITLLKNFWKIVKIWFGIDREIENLSL